MSVSDEFLAPIIERELAILENRGLIPSRVIADEYRAAIRRRLKQAASDMGANARASIAKEPR